MKRDIPMPKAPTTLPEFQIMFPDERACREYIAQVRWPDGFVCPKCDAARGYWLGNGRMECPNGHQTSVTAATAMHRSKQPLSTWLMAAFLMFTLTPGISAVQFQKQMGIKRIETAFNLLHKIRSALVALGRDPLHGEVEVDEGFVGGK